MFRATTPFLAAALLLAPLSSVRAQAPAHNVMAPGVQVLQVPPQARVVPFQPQLVNPAVVVGPQLAAMQQQPAVAFQRQLDGLRRLAAVNAVQRGQMAVLVQEQLQLAVLQDRLNLWATQPLTPMDQQQLANLQQILTALQQQNLLQQMAVLQP